MTATCLATGEWDTNTGEIVCRGKRYSLLDYTCNHTSLLNHLQPLFVIAPAMGADLMQLSPSVLLSRQLRSQSLDC